MPDTPLDDLSALEADYGNHIDGALDASILEEQFKGNETLIWYEAERLNPKPKREENSDGPPPGWQIMLVVSTLMSVGFAALFWNLSKGDWVYFLFPAILAVFFWSIIGVPILYMYFRQKKRIKRAQKQYGLSTRAFYVVQHQKILNRYDFRYMQHLKAILPDKVRKVQLHQGQLRFEYREPAMKKIRYVQLKGVFAPDVMARLIEEQQVFWSQK